MLDIFNIPGQQDNVKIYYTQGTSAWQTWIRPRNCKFVWMMCIGGGSGGFGGGAPAAGLSPGGPSGAVTKALFPANVLPDILYIQVGTGSIGGTGATTSTNNTPGVPGRSFIVINPSGSVPTVMNTVCVSGLANASGTTPESAATVAAAGLLSLGNFTSIAGIASFVAGADYTPLTNTITCPGGAGSAAGVGTAGYGIASVNLGLFLTPAIPGGFGNVEGGATPGISSPGNPGTWFWKPMFGLGGSGGGGVSGSGIVGMDGGNGSYGCGGGGGGNTNSGAGSTGGNGGKGGDGLVIIATF
jgi:hypothetical protein